jgi:hypothetical protein
MQEAFQSALPDANPSCNLGVIRIDPQVPAETFSIRFNGPWQVTPGRRLRLSLRA